VKIFYDTEFIEDGRTIDLISIGMVAEDGRELYCIAEEIAEDPLYDRIKGHNWLMENVVVHLPLKTRYDGKPHIEIRPAGHFGLDLDDSRIMPRRMIRNAVREFIAETPDPELWAWYGAYDHVVYAQLFGRMLDLPDGFPMWTNDLKQEVVRRGNPQLPEQSDGEHNALADARWVKAAYEALYPF
jgi:hypothetical protein